MILYSFEFTMHNKEQQILRNHQLKSKVKQQSPHRIQERKQAQNVQIVSITILYKQHHLKNNVILQIKQIVKSN